MAGKLKTSRNKEIKNKFRFVILNDETFEERFSLSLSHNNVWVFLGVIIFTLVFFTAAAIIYTPLKYFIPGFGDYNYRSQILQLQVKTDSLQHALHARGLWLNDLANVASGNIDTTRTLPNHTPAAGNKQIDLTEVKPEDQELRKEVEDEENYSLSYSVGSNSGVVEEVKQMHLMDPVDGYVTDDFDP
ncbi:MAG TPA: hypothetical protein VG603_05005, partial [Chitinophagales bacterium]|nr:hypothetical protein [Chitinophagales bacterium]